MRTPEPARTVVRMLIVASRVSRCRPCVGRRPREPWCGCASPPSSAVRVDGGASAGADGGRVAHLPLPWCGVDGVTACRRRRWGRWCSGGRRPHAAWWGRSSRPAPSGIAVGIDAGAFAGADRGGRLHRPSPQPLPSMRAPAPARTVVCAFIASSLCPGVIPGPARVAAPVGSNGCQPFGSMAPRLPARSIVVSIILRPRVSVSRTDRCRSRRPRGWWWPSSSRSPRVSRWDRCRHRRRRGPWWPSPSPPPRQPNGSMPMPSPARIVVFIFIAISLSAEGIEAHAFAGADGSGRVHPPSPGRPFGSMPQPAPARIVTFVFITISLFSRSGRRIRPRRRESWCGCPSPCSCSAVVVDARADAGADGGACVHRDLLSRWGR